MKCFSFCVNGIIHKIANFTISEELESEKAKLQETESELKTVKEEYERLKGEMEGIKTAVAYSESNRQDEIEAMRRQCKEEIDTLQSLLNG